MSKSKPSGKSRSAPSRPAPARTSQRAQTSAPPTVSGRWLVSALVIALVGALVCAWGTLCILFWQGSWQLLYRPASAVTRTPAAVNLPFESVGFATNASGEPQLRGWWIPSASPQPHLTAIYLHSQTGNLGDIVDALPQYHQAGLSIFAFDYRGYGQSHFEHPSEKRWREDAESALQYLTGTRHIPASSILIIGRSLGADLALEVAAAHPDLAGIILEQPDEHPTAAIFRDARARLVPAHLLVSDRWDTNTAASNLLIPSLWFYWAPAEMTPLEGEAPPMYRSVPARKTIVWLSKSLGDERQFNAALSAFLDQLQKPGK